MARRRADVVLDANVLVGLLDQNDSLHQRATELLDRMQRNGDRPVMLTVRSLLGQKEFSRYG